MRLLHCNTAFENKNQTWGYYGTVRNYFPHYIPLKTYRTVISYLAKVPHVTVWYGIFSYHNTLPFPTIFFQPICVKKIQQETCHCHVKVQIYRPVTLVVEQNFAFMGYKTFLPILYTSRVKRENFGGGAGPIL